MQFKKIAIVVAAAVGPVLAQSGSPERLLNAVRERALAIEAARLSTDERLRFYQALVGAKPEEQRYQNLLALAHIQKTRETQDFGYLDRAARIVGEVLSKDAANYEALRLRSQIHLERHEFRQAAANSRLLAGREPNDPYNYGTLGDALIELGQYEPAADAYQKMVNLSPDLSSYNRASYYRYLLGDAKGAIEVMKAAVRAGSPAMPESVAWCLAQLGDLYFKQGDLKQAEEAFEAGTRAFPNHHSSLAGLAHVAAARGNIDLAIDYMKRSLAVVPLLDNVALLADYYELTGNKKQAAEQWKLVDFIDRLGQVNKEIYNRNLAMVYANHGLRPEKALQLALRELEVRGDLYTWDAVAWAYFKNGKHAEAERAMEKALQLGTPDPGLYYHAGMIARALGKSEEARGDLERALALNPRFDVKQAPLARKALEEISYDTAVGGGR
ncbi:MAG: tetratricopeptide repeat protein [Acidobacteria bacterium]|nr:tetratricopeptide repeat protein [Acidobacteriota bacterium]